MKRYGGSVQRICAAIVVYVRYTTRTPHTDILVALANIFHGKLIRLSVLLGRRINQWMDKI